MQLQVTSRLQLGSDRRAGIHSVAGCREDSEKGVNLLDERKLASEKGSINRVSTVE